MNPEFKQQSWCSRHRSSRGDWYVLPHKTRKEVMSWMGSHACATHDVGARDARPRDWLPLRGPLSHITEAIEASHGILDFVDEDGNQLLTRATWERAANFLNNSARRLWSNQGIKIDAPDIAPGPDGSVDIHWDRPTYEMLINMPADPTAPIRFYGDDRRGNAVKGMTASHDNRGLLLWLATAMTK
jgi:hypothetical protein